MKLDPTIKLIGRFTVLSINKVANKSKDLVIYKNLIGYISGNLYYQGYFNFQKFIKFSYKL